MRYMKTVLAVIGAATVLVLAGNTVALATTGHSLLLGKSNSADATTSITRTTSGSVLKLQSKSATNSPLVVNGTGKVTNLNVDKVDGLDGGTRALSWTYSGPVTGSHKFVLTGLPAGKYLITYEVYQNQLSSADGMTDNCYLLETSNGSHFGGETNLTESTSYYPGVTGTALMTQPSGGNMALQCNVADSTVTWSALSSQPLRITAIPLAGVTSKGAPTLAKKTARAAAK